MTIISGSLQNTLNTDTYVINLERDLKKKQQLEQNCKEKSIDKHLNIIFKTAVDGSDPSVLSKYSFKICPTWFDPYLKTGIRTGEIGCALSHYDCWLAFNDSNKTHAIFIEDDVEFTDNFEEQYNNLLQYPANADIVYIRRKPLKRDNETNYDSNFINSKASYWTCGYLLTRKGVEKLLNSKYLDNLIVVDEFLPTLYDADYLQQYKSYYNGASRLPKVSVGERPNSETLVKEFDIRLIAYSLVDSFINIVDGSFLESSTFHSSYYNFESTFLALVCYKNCSLSSINRFEQSCKKMSVNYKNVDESDQLMDEIARIDDEKIIILVDPNHTFILNNPREIYNNKDETFSSNFNNKTELLEKFQSGECVFCGKNKYLKQIINANKSAVREGVGASRLPNVSVGERPNSETLVKEFEGVSYYLPSTYIDNKEISLPEVKSILIHGKENPYLLNKYENYFLNNISKHYGFKMKHTSTTMYTKKVRINVMIYSNIYQKMLLYLDKIEYDSNLLDIHIYTNQKIVNNKYNVIHLSELEAYNDVYSYYPNYDYIWFLKSNYVINEASLLKDCIYLDKTISSGMIRKNENDFLSNFWGNMDNNGYYKRSSDYIDILNRNIVNVWNVPYITGNMLFQSNIFHHKNLFVHSKYKDIDMALCANLRNKNESMYLFNQKNYGYIIEISENENFDNEVDGWSEENILHPDFYDFFHNNNNNNNNNERSHIFKEIGSDIWSIPFFTPEFCKYLIELSEKKGNWSAGVYTDPTQVDGRLNKIEEIPTQDIHLNQLGLHNYWTNVTKKYMKKILSHLYKYLTKDYNIAFIAKYATTSGGQTSLKPHHDASVYTINIALNNHTEYEGGGVRFISKNITYLNKQAGYMLLHPGRISHYHEAIPITNGKRYILVSFNN